MEIVEPYATLLDVPDRAAGIKLLQKIEWSGRISHRSEEAQGPETWERFLKSVVLGHGDWSIVEHASATVDAVVDRGITHEIVRHRLFSFTQESTRFCNYEKKGGIRVIEPPGMTEEQAEWWLENVEQATYAYTKMLHAGAAPQIARSVLPTCLASRLIVTGNLRNWRHFLLMRTTKETHPQMRQVTVPLLEQFQAQIPLLFADLVPNETQANAMKRAR